MRLYKVNRYNGFAVWDFCCDDMRDVMDNDLWLLHYSEDNETYDIYDRNDNWPYYIGFKFCPWCGAKIKVVDIKTTEVI